MAQSDFAEKIEGGEARSGQAQDGELADALRVDGLQIEYTDVMTGDKNRNRFLYYQLKRSMGKANRIDMIVSFLMESGVRMILKDLRAALARGVRVRILTGNYLGITQPSALYLIKKELGNRVDLRFYNDGNVRLAVTDDEVLVAWKKFFDDGTNWKDFASDISYAEYKAMTDRQHLSKAKSMPIKFLKASGKGFFIEKEGYALAVREELKDVIGNEAFKRHMKDILEYRTMEYYRRRYALG